jgi:hypothetical protein
MRATDNHFVYLIDDPYIHLSMARNFVEHGVWGVTRYEFSSASSSIAWVSLLALVYVFFDDALFAPLVLNGLLGILLVYALYRELRSRLNSGVLIFAVLLAAAFCMPLVTMIYSGMEHVLQTLGAAAFLFLATRLICARRQAPFSRESLVLLGLAALTTFVRYEGLFQITAVGLFLVLRRRFTQGILLGIAGALTPLIFGLICVANDWPFLPSGILLKGSFLDARSASDVFSVIAKFAREKYYGNPHMTALLVIALILFVAGWAREKKLFEYRRVLLGLYLLVALQHVHFAGLGWLMRYEAYLVALGIVILAIYLCDRAGGDISSASFASIRAWSPGRVALGAALLPLFLLAAVTVGWRALISVTALNYAAREIYWQHYQMARFIGRYYEGQAVAANDIGAINYYNDIRCLDVFGLGSREVAILRNRRELTPERIEELADRADVRVALVYDSWFPDGLPDSWQKAGEWRLPIATTVAGDTVSIYAVGADREVVARQLLEFGETLPVPVKQNVPYVAESGSQ